MEMEIPKNNIQNTTALDKKRKRNFFIFCTSVLAFVFTILAFINYADGLILDYKIDLVIIAVCISALISIKMVTSDMVIYRATYFIVCLTFFYSVSSGTGKESIFYYMFAMPPMLYFFFGKTEGMIWVLLFAAGIASILIVPSLTTPSFGYFVISRFFFTFSIVVIVSYGMESARYRASKLLDEQYQLLHREKDALQQAMSDIKILRGFIPICSNCKKIRNDEGFWEQVETYIRNHSEANFSHGICPECTKKLYPDLHNELYPDQNNDDSSEKD